MTVYYLFSQMGLDIPHLIEDPAVKLYCKVSELPQSIAYYESNGYCVIGITLDTTSPVSQILYDPTLSTPKSTDHIHQGIEGTSVDEEIPRFHEVSQHEIIEEKFDSSELDELQGVSIHGSVFGSSYTINGKVFLF